MGIFYKYRCKNCGKKYTYLPVNCGCCGTKLSFICPMDRWSVFPEYKQTTDCENVFEIAFSFGKKARINELERTIRRLSKDLSEAQKEIEEMQRYRDYIEKKIDLKDDIISSLKMEVTELKHFNVKYKALIKQYQSGDICSSLNVSQDIILAVKYAMKKSHPDNCGNAEDFVRFKKCYEELTRR